jgi:hypothetical protein
MEKKILKCYSTAIQDRINKNKYPVEKKMYNRMEKNINLKKNHKKIISLRQHKVFGIVELSTMILEYITCTIKEKDGITKYTSRKNNLIAARNTCYLWRILGEEILKREIWLEYKEGRHIFFCNICHQNSEKHQTGQTYQAFFNSNKRTWTKDIMFKTKEGSIHWMCDKKCMHHCLKEPGHCTRGKILEYYKMKNENEYWKWREKQIEEYPRIADRIVKRQLEKVLKEDRTILKRVKIEKNGYNSKSITVKVNLEKRRREEDNTQNNNTQDNNKKRKITIK